MYDFLQHYKFNSGSIIKKISIIPLSLLFLHPDSIIKKISVLYQVKARFQTNKKKMEEKQKDVELEVRIREAQEEEERQKEYRRLKRRERKRKLEEAEEEVGEGQEELASIMGFSGFGGSKK